MKLALIYNPEDHKLKEGAYCSIYQGMFDALVKRFDTTHVCKDCQAEDIEADVIMFFDIHSCHHIKIQGIEKHPALKLEYFSDPHQEEMKGVYRQFNLPVHKLGRKERCQRALDRGVSYIVSPVKEGFLKYLGEYIPEKMLWYFPPAPAWEANPIPLYARKKEVLGIGATWDGGLGAYEFRRWAFSQPEVTHVKHCLQDNSTPSGKYFKFLLFEYAGALACSEFYPVPKYFEIPLAGCVCFAQWHKDYEDLGFKHMESCIYVNKDNFKEVVNNFTSHAYDFQSIATNGHELVKNNYTAEHFAEFIYGKTQDIIRRL